MRISHNIFYHVHPPLLDSSQLSPPYPPNFQYLFLFVKKNKNKTEFNLCCSTTLGSVVSLTSVMPLMKITLLLIEASACKKRLSYWRGSASTLGLHAVVWSDLSFVQTCACCHNHCKFVCAIALLYTESTVSSKLSPPLPLTILLPLSFHEDV